MRLSQINSFNFYGKIIDSHVHVGKWSENGKQRDYTKDLDTFTKSPLGNGDTVERAIASNLDCMTYRDGVDKIEFLSDEIVGNKRLLELADKNPVLAPLATCQPGYGNSDNIKKLIEENPNRFVGLKFHPEQLKIPANDSRYYEYMKMASQQNLPCLFHSARTFDVDYSGGGIGKASEFSNPMQIYELARKYKDVPVIMAHWGGDGEANIDFTTKCIIDSIKRKDANLFADISWVDCNDPMKPNLKRIIEQLKADDALDRIFFGTDAPLGRFSEGGENGISPKQAYEDMVLNIKNMIRREFPQDADNIIDKIFYSNAARLFKLESKAEKEQKVEQPKPKPPEPPAKDGKKNKWILFACVVLALGAAGWYYHNKHKEHKSVDLRA